MQLSTSESADLLTSFSLVSRDSHCTVIVCQVWLNLEKCLCKKCMLGESICESNRYFLVTNMKKSILVKRGFTLPTSPKLSSNSDEMMLGRRHRPAARTLQKMLSLDSSADRVCIHLFLSILSVKMPPQQTSCPCGFVWKSSFWFLCACLNDSCWGREVYVCLQ